MTDKFVSLVAVKHDRHHDRCFLFEAPRGCCLKKGEIVAVDTQYGEHLGVVEAVHDFMLVDSTDYNFIVDAMGATKPLKRVMGVFAPYKYEEDE